VINRSDFLKLAGGAVGAASFGLLTACAEGTPSGMGGETSEKQPGAGNGSGQGRVLARPAPPSPHPLAPTGLRPLELGSGRDGLLYVPRVTMGQRRRHRWP
jgi:hypothetical protein